MEKNTGMSCWEWGIRKSKTRMGFLLHKSWSIFIVRFYYLPIAYFLATILVTILLSGCGNCPENGQECCSQIVALQKEYGDVVDRIRRHFPYGIKAGNSTY